MNACGDQHALFAELALLPEGWRSDVLLRWDDAGVLTDVLPGAARDGDIPVAAGPLIPGMPNLHSHAFQRALAGLTETLGNTADSFWSWRTLMYRFAERLQPDHLEAIGRFLYIEMLKAGYTAVCEFHYLHHARAGQTYADPGEHAVRLIHAARDAGIGLTLLPVLYQYSGFGSSPPSPQQARFISSPEWLLELLSRLRHAHPADGNLRYGAAPHSLRAVSADSLERLRAGLHRDDADAPFHLHIAEQTREVDESLAALGARPVRWLLDRQPVDARWCLVHATHMSEDEYDGVAKSGAIVGLCPTTEANLGDGFFDAHRYFSQGGRWGIGSDSHASVSWRSELRLLEYGQRLIHRHRNVLATAAEPATADRLYAAAARGGAMAAARPIGHLAVGLRADFVVLDGGDVDLAGHAPSQLLAGLVFGEHGSNPIRDVFVGGVQVVTQGCHPREEMAAHAYRSALRELLS